MNPERAQMLREIRREYCPTKCMNYSPCIKGSMLCMNLIRYIEDLFAEAELLTGPKGD